MIREINNNNLMNKLQIEQYF